MPTRKIGKSYRNVTGVLASRKNDRMIHSESTLERDLYNLLEFDPLVESYEEQPVTLPYRIPDGAMSRYTPDVLIHLKVKPEFVWQYSPFRRFYGSSEYSDDDYSLKPKINGIPPKAVLVEVKYRNDLFKIWKESKPKFKAARLYAAEKRWQFRIITEKEIRTQLLRNVKFIRSFARHAFSIEEIMTVLNKIAQLESCRMGELLIALSDDPNVQGAYIPVIWQLVMRHEIAVDWHQPLTMDSLLTSVV